MSLYTEYLEEIAVREKELGLHPKPIDSADLLAEIIEQIKLVGVNNIIIKPIVEQTEEDLSEEEESSSDQKKFSTGLTLADKNSISNTIPGLASISPEILPRPNSTSTTLGME